MNWKPSQVDPEAALNASANASALSAAAERTKTRILFVFALSQASAAAASPATLAPKVGICLVPESDPRGDNPWYYIV